MAECDHNCANCQEANCAERKIKKKTPLPGVEIKKIIGVLSGKGGVGKSMVSALLAIDLAKKGYKVGIMDADITGPSIPKMFSVEDSALGDEGGIFPNLSLDYGIKIISVNLLLETEDTPVLWRGPILSNMVDQFYTAVYWEKLDYLIIDMPPGTSDIAISVLQDVPVDGLVMVSSASKLVSMVVSKTVRMAEMTKAKIIGLVENMSYIKCPDCGKEIRIYDAKETEEVAAKFGLPIISRIPLDVNLSNFADNGIIEKYNEHYIDDLVKAVEAL